MKIGSKTIYDDDVYARLVAKARSLCGCVGCTGHPTRAEQYVGVAGKVTITSCVAAVLLDSMCRGDSDE